MSAEPLRNYNDLSSQDDDNEEFERPSVVSRTRAWVRKHFWGEPDHEELESVQPTETVQPAASLVPTTVNAFRQQTVAAPARNDRPSDVIKMLDPRDSRRTINVLKTITKEEDVRLAADALKDGQEVLLNLERCNQMAAEEIINFLSGVCYAKNGQSEKVSDKVFLFLPDTTHLMIDFKDPNAEEKAPQQRKSMFDVRNGTV